MSVLRYGIIGGGFITSFQLEALRQVRGVEVAGFVSKDPLDQVVAGCHCWLVQQCFAMRPEDNLGGSSRTHQDGGSLPGQCESCDNG